MYCVFLCVCVKHITRLNIYSSTISLSEITHSMWQDHPFSQRNKASKIVVEVKVGGNGKEALDKILKR